MLRALAAYTDEIAPTAGEDDQPSWTAELIEVAARVADESSPSAQRQAFAEVRELVVGRDPERTIDPDQDLTARQNARRHAGLSTFPNDASATTAVDVAANAADSADSDAAKLLDVEVVAIYW